METIQELCDTLNFSDYSSAIIHGLARLIDNCPELRQVAMDTLCCLVVQLGHKYTVFIPMMTKVSGCVSLWTCCKSVMGGSHVSDVCGSYVCRCSRNTVSLILVMRCFYRSCLQ